MPRAWAKSHGTCIPGKLAREVCLRGNFLGYRPSTREEDPSPAPALRPLVPGPETWGAETWNGVGRYRGARARGVARRVLPAVPTPRRTRAAAAGAQGGEDLCLSSPPAAPTRPSNRLRFGVTPRLAGSEGASQQPAVPVQRDATQAALRDLEPPGRTLVLRLNRLFSADGRAGISRFARQVDRHARDGFRSEIQVRYHPRPAKEGDMKAWAKFVRRAVGTLARRPSVVAFSIVNEANLPVSPNTSDGAYDRVVDAVVRGIVAGQRELRQVGRPRVPLGFTIAWRYLPEEDASFWRRLGNRATPRFRRALDYVGLQVYPGLFWPPVIRPGRTAGYEVAEAATLVRRCFMPKARARPKDRPVDQRERLLDAPGGRRRAGSGREPDLHRARPPPALGDARDHGLPLLQPARQPLHRDRPVRPGGSALRRLRTQAVVRRPAAADAALRSLSGVRPARADPAAAPAPGGPTYRSGGREGAARAIAAVRAMRSGGRRPDGEHRHELQRPVERVGDRGSAPDRKRGPDLPALLGHEVRPGGRRSAVQLR